MIFRNSVDEIRKNTRLDRSNLMSGFGPPSYFSSIAFVSKSTLVPSVELWRMPKVLENSVETKTGSTSISPIVHLSGFLFGYTFGQLSKDTFT